MKKNKFYYKICNQKPAEAGIGGNMSSSSGLPPNNISIAGTVSMSSGNPQAMDGTGIAPVDSLVATHDQNYSPPTAP